MHEEVEYECIKLIFCEFLKQVIILRTFSRQRPGPRADGRQRTLADLFLSLIYKAKMLQV